MTSRALVSLFCGLVLAMFLGSGPAWGTSGDASESLLLGAEEASSSYADIPQFGGPSSVGAGLTEDRAPKTPWYRFPGAERRLRPYFDWKERLNERYGMAFGVDYTTLYQVATESAGHENQAASGIARLFGTWTLVDRGGGSPGSLVFKGENRHRLGTDIAPQGLGFEIGYAGLTGQPFNDFDWGLTNLYWQQRLFDGRIGIVGGLVDATDYLDVYGLTNPWTQFSNLSFGLNGTIPAPNQGLGLAAGAFASEHVYVVAGLTDANGDPADPGQGFETFFEDAEYFSHVELGWVSSRDRRYLDNIHVTAWNVDARHDAGTPAGWGMAFSAAWFVNDVWMPFLRGGYGEDGGALMEGTVNLGVGRYFAESRDLLAVGVGWGKPQGAGLDDQYTLEVFYRLQLLDHLAITPMVQVLVEPALSPDDDVLGVFGLRARLEL